MLPLFVTLEDNLNMTLVCLREETGEVNFNFAIALLSTHLDEGSKF